MAINFRYYPDPLIDPEVIAFLAGLALRPLQIAAKSFHQPLVQNSLANYPFTRTYWGQWPDFRFSSTTWSNYNDPPCSIPHRLRSNFYP
jgi:hypothetical protein